jgi:type II secretory pathway pseudopilin PulG
MLEHRRDLSIPIPGLEPETGSQADPQSGFYQTEILVGITILLLVIAIVASYYKYNVKATKGSNDFYVSTQIAAAALEKAKGDISNPDTLAALLAKVADTTHTRKSTVNQQGKVFAVEVKFRKVSPTANLMRIKASVRWDATHGNALGTVYPYEP